MSDNHPKTSSELNVKVQTHSHEKWRLRFGHPLPFGVSRVPGGINFAIYSKHATACTLVLFERGNEVPFAEIPFPREFRMGDVYAMTVFDLDFEMIEYGYRFDGPNDPALGHLFDPKKILLDPFAREISGRDVWQKDYPTSATYPHRARIHGNNFEWGHDRPLELPSSDLVIYEMHVRGFTRHPSSGVKHPGTYNGMREKIAYLKDLGVNCVEVMPIFEFDEWENPRSNPNTGELLCNYWGYSTIGFFAPKSGYAAAGEEGRQVEELKTLIMELHSNGIEIMLDVVFNHTAEGGEGGPVISFKGIDNKTYYLLNPDKTYANYTGCGNTLNCNHPIVRHFVMDSMRYWAAEFHIDGFRFDLASVLSRDSNGVPMANPPLLESIAYDPVLAHCELVAEAWDAAGLYQVGNFPAYSRWSEWNGRFRDAARKFIKGDRGLAGEMVQRILGSPDLYAPGGRKPQASINFITCHDGFTLRDLFSYNDKHNLANGEENRDGATDNYSWNCGVEGPTDDVEINALRLRLQKNSLALLFVSQGVPMLYMGDECGRTQNGNNNAYCQDKDWNWFDWSLPARESELFRFTKNLIALRKAHPSLRRREFFTGKDQVGSGYPDISWHGVQPWKPDWTPGSTTIAFMICGKHSEAEGGTPCFIYCVFNSHYDPLDFGLPTLPVGREWHQFANSSLPAPHDIYTPGEEVLLGDQRMLPMASRSCAILIGK